MDLERISDLLRKLSPRQEKVIRLFFGLGCQRPHSAQEVAQEFGVSVQAIAGLLGAAQRRLAQAGLTSSQLRQAARGEADLRPSSSPRMEAGSKVRRHTGSHRRCRSGIALVRGNWCRCTTATT
jgi:Sigma-70, region 4